MATGSTNKIKIPRLFFLGSKSIPFFLLVRPVLTDVYYFDNTIFLPVFGNSAQSTGKQKRHTQNRAIRPIELGVGAEIAFGRRWFSWGVTASTSAFFSPTLAVTPR